MALIRCPECGREISDQAAFCPGCGYPVRTDERQAGVAKGMAPLVTCRCHWSAYAKYVLGMLLCFLCVPFVPSGGWTTRIFLIVAGLAVMGCGVIIIRSQYLSISESVITGRRGVFNVSKLTSPIGRVQNVSVHSSLAGRIFGYATITVATAGTGKTEYIYKDMTNTDRFQKEFIRLSGS